MKGVILQPSYIPWRGVFDQIQRADLFVFYDDVQYDRRGWRNRNRIKTQHGSDWLTIPVQKSGNVREELLLKDILTVPDSNWERKHLTALRHAYSKAPQFKRYEPLLAEIYRDPPERLAEFTIQTTITLARELGIRDTRFLRSSELGVTGSGTEHLLQVMQQAGIDHYISGPSASAYIETELLDEAGITLEFVDYTYPEYPQLYPPFDPKVSVLDLLFMQGSAAGEFIWG